MAPRLIAFHLPQYHRVRENDEWWGSGFTDWTNTAKARPLFRGHEQPHVPAELGCYDLTDPAARRAQADLARAHGLHGFCHYHYWFHGRRLLERPVDGILASGQPDFPFCLCWANEPWTRAWGGRSNEVLMAQAYSEADDRAHVEWLLRAFGDPRAIRVQGRVLFLVYRAEHLPQPRRTTDLWRAVAAEHGLGLYLCKLDCYMDSRRDPAELGFDAAVEFQPDGRLLSRTERLRWAAGRLLGFRRGALAVDYARFARRALSAASPPYQRFPCVTPGWDNSARRTSGAFLLHRPTPAAYEAWLARALHTAERQWGDDGIVFVNAWNEWAEGCHLEPCRRWGRAYLEATRRAVEQHACERGRGGRAPSLA